tara:strand:- start:48 stop:398 length:351 start_codon:yes stop_codon:yes gene_type:complete
MNIKSVILGAILFTIAQIFIWYQGNGQFVYKWFKENPIILSFVGVPISYVLILATRYVVEGLGGSLWPMRMIGFSSGIVVFTFLTWYHMNEAVNLKTVISLGLAVSIVLIQIFWKS